MPRRRKPLDPVALQRAWADLPYRADCCCATCRESGKGRRGRNPVSRVCWGCFVDVHLGVAPNYRRRQVGDLQLPIASLSTVAPIEGRRPVRALAIASCIAVLLILAPAGRAAPARTINLAGLQRLVAARFSPAGTVAVRRAFCIVGRESSWNPRAVSSTGDYGLFQINYSAHHSSYDWSRILQPAYNTAVAWRLSNRGTDFSPWKGGRYWC